MTPASTEPMVWIASWHELLTGFARIGLPETVTNCAA